MWHKADSQLFRLSQSRTGLGSIYEDGPDDQHMEPENAVLRRMLILP